MQRNRRKSKIHSLALQTVLLLSASSIAVAPAVVLAQAPAPAATPAPNPKSFLGTVTAVGSGLLTVKTDAGVERKVTVPDGIKLQRIAPGEKSLANAATIQFADLAVGDRVLIRTAPDPTADPVTALAIVAIPQADLAQKQQHDREEWQRNGVGGLVKSVDAGTGLVVITSGAGPTQKTITLHTTPATVLRRYAPGSVSFDLAKPAPLAVIMVGDQLRARGTKSPDGTDVTAEEVVSGSFRNISGTISSVNVAAMTITLKDLATKQSVTVHIGPDAQMRKLPEMMARVLSNMTKPADASAPKTGVPQAGTGAGPGSGHANGSTPPSGAPAGGPPAGMGGGGFGGRPSGSGDLQQMLNRAPAIHLADLQKDDAVMLVSTQGTTDVTAVTLLAGVEPLLEAPASTQNMLLSGWNMSSGGAEAAQ